MTEFAAAIGYVVIVITSVSACFYVGYVAANMCYKSTKAIGFMADYFMHRHEFKKWRASQKAAAKLTGNPYRDLEDCP